MQASCWVDVKADVPNGLILSPLFSVNCINDLTEYIKSNIKRFVENTSIFGFIHNLRL